MSDIRVTIRDNYLLEVDYLVLSVDLRNLSSMIANIMSMKATVALSIEEANKRDAYKRGAYNVISIRNKYVTGASISIGNT
jgi:hypothetical protein